MCHSQGVFVVMYYTYRPNTYMYNISYTYINIYLNTYIYTIYHIHISISKYICVYIYIFDIYTYINIVHGPCSGRVFKEWIQGVRSCPCESKVHATANLCRDLRSSHGVDSQLHRLASI